MPISQTECYFKNAQYRFFGRTYALSVGFKKKAKTKNYSNFAVNLAEMLKEATIHFCLFDESHFSNICTLQYVTIECID